MTEKCSENDAVNCLTQVTLKTNEGVSKNYVTVAKIKLDTSTGKEDDGCYSS